jgi:ribosomal protein L37AE/L43A
MTKEYDDVQYPCRSCGDDVASNRWALGYRVCLPCGESIAVSTRASWCVIQPYGKGPYMLVTPTAAFSTLLDTNQKQLRS